MYKAAIDARPSGLHSEALDETAVDIDRLWAELGGTLAGKELWAKGSNKLVASTSANWERVSKELPPWQLPDLQGKIWSLTSFEGKILLINLWASWCAPCRSEHPHLQKLYEQFKNRPDIQIITFNVDDEIGVVAPYMREHHYTFPVLLAKSYVDDLVPVVSGIPRNWIVDAKGRWQWEQRGYNSDGDWEEAIRGKIEDTRAKQTSK